MVGWPTFVYNSRLQASAVLCIQRNDAVQVWGTCLGHQLQMILTANVDFNDLLITTDAVVSLLVMISTLPFLGMQAN